jgi:hypothetical protein
MISLETPLQLNLSIWKKAFGFEDRQQRGVD